MSEWGTNVEWEQVWDVFSLNTKKPSYWPNLWVCMCTELDSNPQPLGFICWSQILNFKVISSFHKSQMAKHMRISCWYHSTLYYEAAAYLFWSLESTKNIPVIEKLSINKPSNYLPNVCTVTEKCSVQRLCSICPHFKNYDKLSVKKIHLVDG